MASRLKPRKRLCRTCGAEIVAFTDDALCEDCIAAAKGGCRCRFPDWEPLSCPIHWGRNPFDIPY